jgi:ABC-type multidrug transport system ATPase subunit
MPTLSQQKRLCHPTAKHRPCIVQILALDDIRNEIIGDEEVRGISGGQRKRVNVGLELVADPIMLFLDEPTSGLDSTSSKMVISALQQVCARK